MKRRPGLVLFALALLLRLAYLGEAADAPTFHVPVLDSLTYLTRAGELLQGGGIKPELFWQPVAYPVFLAGVLGLFANSLLAVRIVQAILGALTCFLTWRLGKRLFDRRTGFVAGLIVALYGPLIFFDGELLATGPAALLAVALVLLFLQAADTRRSRTLFLVGVVSGLAVLTRPTFLPFVAGGGIWLLVGGLRSVRAGAAGISGAGVARVVLAGVAGFFLLTAPVAFLSERSTGRLAVTPYSGGLNVYIGNNPDMVETLTIRPGWKWARLVQEPLGAGDRTPETQNRYFYGRVRTFAETRPFAFLEGLGSKALRLVSGREIPRNVSLYAYRSWSVILSALVWKAGPFGFPFGLMLPLAAAGLWMGGRRSAFLLWFLIAYGGALVLVFTSARYRIPLVPVLAVPAAAGAIGFVNAVRGGGWSKRRIPLALAAGFLVLGTVTVFPEERLDYRAELFYLLGEAKEQNGDRKGAAQAYRQALKDNADMSEAQAHLGDLLLTEGRIPDAVQNLQQALVSDPDNVTALHRLGLIAYRQHDFDEAVRFYRHAVEVNPNNARLQNSLAFCLDALGRTEEALPHYAEAVRLNPTDWAARGNFANVLIKMKRPRQAVALLEEAVAADPREAGMLRGLASILAAYPDSTVRNPDRAVRLAESAAALAPGTPAPLDVLAMAYAAAGRFPEAIAAAQRAAAAARASGNEKQAAGIEQRLALYREGRPYRFLLPSD